MTEPEMHIAFDLLERLLKRAAPEIIHAAVLGYEPGSLEKVEMIDDSRLADLGKRHQVP